MKRLEPNYIFGVKKINIYFETSRIDYDQFDLFEKVFPEIETKVYKQYDYLICEQQTFREISIDDLMLISRVFNVEVIPGGVIIR